MPAQGLAEGFYQGLSEIHAAHVLLLQDSSTFTLSKYSSKHADFGRTSAGQKGRGFHLHPTLAVDAEQEDLYGLAHLHWWTRSTRQPSQKEDPIEQKESYRWLASPLRARQRIPASVKTTMVADRESDIYELFERLPPQGVEVLLRAAQDRKLAFAQGERLFHWISEQPLQGQVDLILPAIPGKRQARQAKLQLRFGRLSILPPGRLQPQSQPIELYFVEALESAESVPAKEQPVHWRLLTTHCVQDLQQAQVCLRWYRQRWQIEQLFRTLKKQGLRLESSQLESRESFEKLTVLAVGVSVRTLQLVQAREGSQLRVGQVFSVKEVEVLRVLSTTLEGRTKQQQNPHQGSSLAWAAWIIARLGGWKGHARERKAGPITMFHGLQRFEQLKEGFQLAQQQKDLCIP